MTDERVALFTAVYPGVERYLQSWYTSVASQTDRNFDLWIAVDDLAIDRVVDAIGDDPVVRWINAAEGSTPAQVRQAGLQEIVHEYPAVVLVDSDDILLPARVASAKEALEQSDIAGCAASIMDEEERDLAVVLQLPPEARVPDFLLRHNVFGLSNTAYRSEILRQCLPFPKECKLIDWFLVMQGLGSGARISFDRTPRMRYRQHRANTARVLPPFDAAHVLYAAELVLGHYDLLIGSGRLMHPEYVNRLRGIRNGVADFSRCMKGDPELLARYVQALNALPPEYVWWWSVAHPNLEGLWKA